MPLLEVLLHFTDKYRPGCTGNSLKKEKKNVVVFFFLRPCLFVSNHHLCFWPETLASQAAQHHFTSLLSPPTARTAPGLMSHGSVLCLLSPWPARREEIRRVMSPLVTHLWHQVALQSAVAAVRFTVVWANSLCADKFISAPQRETSSRQSLWLWCTVSLVLPYFWCNFCKVCIFKFCFLSITRHFHLKYVTSADV